MQVRRKGAQVELVIVVVRLSCMQAFCDNQKDLLEHSIANLPNQASSGDDYTKMSWPQVEKKVTG